jgi:hypothetical protein
MPSANVNEYPYSTDKVFSVCYVFTSRCLVTDRNNASLLKLAPRLAAVSRQPPTLLTFVSRLYSNSRWPSLYSFGTDRKENTDSNSFDIVGCVRCGHYLAAAVVYRANT